MSAIVWHEIGTKVYENGVSHGVLYLPDGTAVPWNGLVSVEQEEGGNVEALWFDGMKLGDLVELSDYKGTLQAITFPDELINLMGNAHVSSGVWYDGQRYQPFGLSWKTQINSDAGQDIGYKIHILWNVIAVPKSVKWETLSDNPELNPFEWDISATPEDMPDIRPSAHVTIDSREVRPEIIADLERILYGDEDEDASLPGSFDFYDFVAGWALLRITDNHDGTWTATTASFNPEIITDLGGGEFEITDCNTTTVNATTYTISSTVTEDDIT